ncbi:acetyl-CoA carboxylase biotin carboxylase subunit family protein [Mesorhizobium ciceri]|uniref:ATP-grasp domain-containing protein n=1 Tax=Mesorhizobium TaxID=68287 RepID=UPI0007A9588A|nr:acetyl-CoA carboxylase biotin carboxylase subunit family protein [Mesorhizobium ciceri]AMY03395.1 hypothetical protein A4R29_04820 [Mesorhizobium ciceri biovar biserrulae]
MTRRAIILLDGLVCETLIYSRAARRLRLNPIILSADPGRYDYIAAERIEAIRVDTDNLDALICECSRLNETYDIAGITCAGDSFYATVGKLCQYFNLPGPNPESIERCCDKFIQRQLLAQAGLPVPAYRLAADAMDIESSAAQIGLPVVLKPAVGSCSSGVRLCRNADELAEHTTYLFGGKHRWQSSPRVLVEEFANGPFYSADIMGSEVVGIEAVDFDSPPHFVFRQLTFPAPLINEDYQRIAEVSLSCLKALGLGWGPTNIEFRWTKRGPVVIEVNPRLPGGPNPRLVQLAYGVDLFTEHIKLVIGDQWDLRRTNSHTALARRLIPDRDGILDWVNGDSRAAEIPGVVEVKLEVEPKTPIVRKGDWGDCIGSVIAVSPTLAGAEAILQTAVDLIDWSITPFPTDGGEQQSAAQGLSSGPNGSVANSS